jgi:hypothetical protein
LIYSLPEINLNDKEEVLNHLLSEAKKGKLLSGMKGALIGFDNFNNDKTKVSLRFLNSDFTPGEIWIDYDDNNRSKYEALGTKFLIDKYSNELDALKKSSESSLIYPISIPGEVIQHHLDEPLLVTDESIQYGTVKKTGDQTNKNSVYIDKDGGTYAISDVPYIVFKNPNLNITSEELSKSIIQYLVSNGRYSPDINKVTNLPNGELMLLEIEKNSGTIVKKVGENSYILNRLNNTGNAIIVDKNWNIKIANKDDITLSRDEWLIIVEGNFNNNDEIVSFVESILEGDLSQYDDYSFIRIEYDESNLDDNTKIKNNFDRLYEEKERELSIIEKDNGQYIIYIDEDTSPDIYNNKADAEEALRYMNKDVNKSLLLLSMLINNNVDTTLLLKNGFESIDEIIATLKSYQTGLNSLIEDYINNIINTIQPVEPTTIDEQIVNKLKEYINKNDLQLTIIDNKLFPIEIEYRQDDGYYFNNRKIDVREIEANEYFSNVVKDNFYYVDLNNVLNDVDTLYEMFSTIYMRQSRTDQTRNLNLSMTNALIDTLDMDIKKEFATRYLETLETDARSDTNYIAYIKNGDDFEIRSTVDTNYKTKLIKSALKKGKRDFKYLPSNNDNKKITINSEAIAKGNIKIFEGKVKTLYGIGFTGKKIKGKTEYSGKKIHFATFNGSETVLLYDVISDEIEYEITATKENSVVTLKELPFLFKSTPTKYMIYTIHDHGDGNKLRNKPITIYTVPPYLNLFLYENNDFIKDFEDFIENENKINLIDFFTLIYTNSPTSVSKANIDDKLYDSLLNKLKELSKLISNYDINFKVNLVNAYLQVFNYNILLFNDQRYLSMFNGKFIYDNNSHQYIIDKAVVDGDTFFQQLSEYLYNQLNILNDEKAVFEWFKENGNITFDDISEIIEEKKVIDVDNVITDDDSNNSVEEFESNLKLNTSNAVANSHVVPGTLATNYFKSYNSIFGEVNVKDNVFAQRRDSIRNLLEGKLIISGVPTEINISLETTDNIDIRKTDRSLLTLNTKDDYRKVLEEIFEIHKNDKLYLYNRGILELMYMNDIILDKDNRLVLTLNDTNVKNLLSALTPEVRQSVISEHFNKNPIDLDIAKEIFIISKTQFIIDTVKENKHIGYVHDLEYLVNEKRSISYFDNYFNKKDIGELLDNEVIYIKEGFEFLAKIYYEHTDNVKKEYSMTLENYGKLNVVNESMVSSLASFRKTDNLTFYQLSAERLVDGLFGIKLMNFTDNDNHLTKLYDNPEVDSLFYIFNILKPMIGVNEEWEDILRDYIIKVLGNNNTSWIKEDKLVFSIIDAYTNPEILTPEHKRNIENAIITNKWQTVIDDKTSYGYINSGYLVKISNPFEIDREVEIEIDGVVKNKKRITKNRFLNLGNVTLNTMLNNVDENYGKTTSNDPQENTEINTHIASTKQYLLDFKEKLVEKTVDILLNLNVVYSISFIFNDYMPSSNLLEKANLLRRIFKMTAIGSPKFQGTNSTRNIAQSLADSKKEVLGTFYLKYINEIKGHLFLAVKKEGVIKVLNITDRKLYIYNTDMERPNVVSMTDEIEFEKLIRELLQDVYLNLSYTNLNLNLDSTLQKLNNIEKYNDLIRVITNTNINGISGHYFINPVLSVTDSKHSNTTPIPSKTPADMKPTNVNITFKEYFEKQSIFKTWRNNDKYNTKNIDVEAVEKYIKDMLSKMTQRQLSTIIFHDRILQTFEAKVCPTDIT